MGKFCSTLVIAFITLESFLTMLRVATLYPFVCFLYNTPPGAKWGLCRSTIYSKFLISHQIFYLPPFHTKFFIYNHFTPNFSFLFVILDMFRALLNNLANRSTTLYGQNHKNMCVRRAIFHKRRLDGRFSTIVYRRATWEHC